MRSYVNIKSKGVKFGMKRLFYIQKPNLKIAWVDARLKKKRRNEANTILSEPVACITNATFFF